MQKKFTRNRAIEIMKELKNLKYFQNPAHRKKYIRNQSGRIALSFNLIRNSLNKDSAVLDLGIAPYFFAHLIKSQYNCKIYGIGLSASGAEEMEENFGFPTYYCNIEIDKFPFEDSTFDIVVCTEVLEHLVMNPSHTLSEIHRVLKSRGILLISTPNAVSLTNRFALLFGRNIFAKYSLDHIYGRHNRLFTRRELKKLLKDSNYEIEKCIMFTDTTPFKKRIAKLFALVGSLVSPNLRDKIIILARKFGETKMAFPESVYRHSLKTD